MTKEAMDLKESKEGQTGEFTGRKGKRGMVQLYDDLKRHKTFEKRNKVSENIGSQIGKCSSV